MKLFNCSNKCVCKSKPFLLRGFQERDVDYSVVIFYKYFFAGPQKWPFWDPQKWRFWDPQKWPFSVSQKWLFWDPPNRPKCPVRSRICQIGIFRAIWEFPKEIPHRLCFSDHFRGPKPPKTDEFVRFWPLPVKLVNNSTIIRWDKTPRKWTYLNE